MLLFPSFTSTNLNKQIYMNNQVQPNPYLSQPEESQAQILSSHNHAAESIVQNLIQEIIKAAQLKIRHNELLANHLNKFSNTQTIKDLQEVSNLFFNIGGNKYNKEKEEDEPKPLYVDSLLPISADVDAENLYKNSLKKISMLEESSIRARIVKDILPDFKQKYRKLQLTEVSEEDTFTKELRRVSEDNKRKAETDRIAEEKIIKMKLEKQKGKKNQNKISYDYSGNMMEIKTQNKKNLISAIIDGNTDPKSKLIKEAKNDQNPTTLQGVNPNKAKLKKIELPTQASKKRQEVQFSNVNTLADSLKTTYGVKYIYQGKTYEEKKRVLTTNELKKTLSQRRLSRDQFQMMKRLNSNNREEFEENLKKSTLKSNLSEVKHLRTQSEIKLSEVKAKRTSDAIHINDAILKNKMLEKAAKVQDQIQQKKDITKDEDEKIRLGTINSFNLEYIKTGGSLKASTSRQFYGKSINELPKIAHTTLYSHTKPKGRERIKDANEILREMRKKFEQKLRV